MILPPPGIPWQVTGNHWLTLPCIHPVDASIHLAGVIHAQSRAAIEFAGSGEFMSGTGLPLVSLIVVVDGKRQTVGANGLSWQREFGWLPSFTCRFGDVLLRGTIFAPHGRDADMAGAVVAVAVENRSTTRVELLVGIEGTLGYRQQRVRTPVELMDGHRATAGDDGIVVLEGAGMPGRPALAVGGEGDCTRDIHQDLQSSWTIRREAVVEPGAVHEDAFMLSAGPERDGAMATLRTMKRRGWRSLLAATRTALQAMEPSTGVAAADRMISRNMFFTYFCGVARAIDDSQIYVMRSRIPWNGRGLTIRDWEALMWILPAVQLADEQLAREVLLRVCELHGHSPGGGVHYLDGSVFEPGFSLEGAASFPIAVDAYIVHTGDEQIVEDPILADSLYGANEDIEARKDTRFPLYSTEINPDGGVPAHRYTIHGNAVTALALDVLRRTLDEKTSAGVQDSAAVRAAAMRHFAGQLPGGKSVLAASSNLDGNASAADEPAASMYWLPYFDLVGRDESVYRRTVKRLELETPATLEQRCARLVGINTDAALDWLRRAPLDGGLAAELVDEEGTAAGNGGDAALSGLIAYTVWYSVHALGARV